MGKIEEKKQLKKQILMDTAFRLFTTQGFIHTTISDIVEHSGIAKGTFYLYFRDKHDLQEHLIASKANILFRHAVQCSDYADKTDPTDKIIAIFDDILAELQKDRVLLKFINKNLSWGIFSRALSGESEEMVGFFRNILNVSDVKTMEIMIYSIVELVSSTCYSVIIDSDPVDLETYRPYLEDMVRHIVTTFPNKEFTKTTE